MRKDLRYALCVAALAAGMQAVTAGPVAAQDVLAAARKDFSDGRAQAAIARLDRHLQAAPGDVDARVLLGSIYSWGGQYDDARRELKRVLQTHPSYGDAVSALANVEIWSGNAGAAVETARTALERDDSRIDLQLVLARALHARGESREARRIVHRVLGRAPDNAAARELRRTLGIERLWEITTGYAYDRFDDGRAGWRETAVSVKRDTPAGAVFARLSHAARFGLDDDQLEIEMYPRLGTGRYAYVSVGVSPDAILYPERRFAADIYQSLPRGFEATVGYRRLAFASPVDIYTPAISKYAGAYLFTARLYLTPNLAGTSQSLHLSARRYLPDGISYVGVRVNRGAVREEVRDLNDTLVLDSTGLSAEVNAAATDRLLVGVSGGFSNEERADRVALRQYSIRVGVSVRF
jgi:YaiO family outer membrane protein